MNSLPVNSPEWLSKIILKKGGTISFYDYMNIVLNDSQNGFYGSGKANLGINGDFVTSPSLSFDFSYFLSVQIEEWIEKILEGSKSNTKLNLVEFGSGDGLLLKGILDYFLENNKKILKNISFIIIESNKGMKEKQIDNLKIFLEMEIDIKWIDLYELKDKSITGVIIANEVLDAFPVERINYSKGEIYRKGVAINKRNGSLEYRKLKISSEIKEYINYANQIGIQIPPRDVSEGWSTEIHIDTSSWLNMVNKKLKLGILLVIDYAIDSKKYYSVRRSEGTLLAYKDQKAYNDFLISPGNYDLTCHLCSDILINQAKLNGFKFKGLIKQGEALLSLGLAKELSEIKNNLKNDLSKALLKRESLLRLVDPLCLGDFKWFIFQKSIYDLEINSRCIS